MITTSIYTKALTNLRNYRSYSTLYCRYGKHLAPSSLAPITISKSNYLYLPPCRFQHQERDKDSKIKNQVKQSHSTMTENIVVRESMKDKLKKAVKEYGSTVIIFHIGISLISLGTCYLLISAGLDVRAILNYIGLESLHKNDLATSAGTFAVAYAVHKVFAPVRIAITLGSVPFIVRYLRRIGFLKK